MTEMVQSPVVFRAGKRLYLRPVEEEDLPKFVLWINDQTTSQFIMMNRPLTLAEEREWFSNLPKRKNERATFSIVLLENHELIGNTSLGAINHQNGTAVTGSVIGTSGNWGRGFGTEAKMLLLDYAFNTLNLRKVCSSVFSFNLRSKKHLEKCGYKEEGVRKAQYFVNGSYCDEIMMAVFREDFLPLWEKYKREVLQSLQT